MSVTFSIEAIPTGRVRVSCMETGDVEVCDTYDEALVVRAIHMASCEECRMYGCYTSGEFDIDDEFDVNLSNLNAGMMLRTLGLYADDEEGGLVGRVSGEQFLGAVLLALGTDHADDGVESLTTTTPGGATWIDCGLRPGYIDGTLRNLHAVGVEAVRLGRDVVWS